MTRKTDPYDTETTSAEDDEDSIEMVVDIEAAENLMAELKKVASFFVVAHEQSQAQTEQAKKPCRRELVGPISGDALSDIAGGMSSSFSAHMSRNH